MFFLAMFPLSIVSLIQPALSVTCIITRKHVQSVLGEVLSDSHRFKTYLWRVGGGH